LPCTLVTLRWDDALWQTEVPVVAEPSSCGVEVTAEKLKRYKSSGIDHILAELMQGDPQTF